MKMKLLKDRILELRIVVGVHLSVLCVAVPKYTNIAGAAVELAYVKSWQLNAIVH